MSALMLLSGCSSRKNSNPEPFYMEIDPDRQIQNFGQGAGYKSLTVLSNCTVEANSNQEWCTPRMLDYTADNLRITVTENISTDSRTAVVSVSAVEINRVTDITVNQTGITPAVSVDKTSITLRNSTLDFSLNVTSNVPVVFETPEWIAGNDENTWKTGLKTYSFTALPLPAGTSFRGGNIVIRTVETFADVQAIPVYVTQHSSTRIIAHRGYWNKSGAAQNSLAALNNAIELGAYGSELDVWITADNVIVLNHDATYGGVSIENSRYSAIEPLRLSNGEPLPTLQQCIDIAKQQRQAEKTRLVIEIKTHSNNANNKRCVDAVVKAVNDSGAEDLVDYIAFSSYVCEELIKSNPQHRVAYLNGNLTPAALKSAGYWGLDYTMSILKNNAAWISQAKEAGLTTNVWTVNSAEDMRYFISAGADFITTDNPHILKELLDAE
jgi:glycerophosphoryl diester phosphodiesterase